MQVWVHLACDPPRPGSNWWFDGVPAFLGVHVDFRRSQAVTVFLLPRVAMKTSALGRRRVPQFCR